jgi:hypothetical protein
MRNISDKVLQELKAARILRSITLYREYGRDGETTDGNVAPAL